MKRRKLTDKEKKEISKLADLNFIKDTLDQKLKSYYPDFRKVLEIDSKIYKKYIGITRVFFVIGYHLVYQTDKGRKKKLSIFTSAHTDETRKKAFEMAKVLYANGFDRGKYQVTKPLFYLNKQHAFFYEASSGESLFAYIEKFPKKNFKPALKLAAGWLRELHRTDLEYKYEWSSFRVRNISTVKRVFNDDFFKTYINEGKLVDELMERMFEMEKKFDKTAEKTIIYGDFHPENIIMKKIDSKNVKMIDFTDLALGDPMVDIGIFINQLEFMTHDFVPKKKMTEYKRYFIQCYFGKPIEKIEIEYINRINFYQAWTALRSAVVLFYMENLGPSVGGLLWDAKLLLDLAESKSRKLSVIHQ